MLEVLKHRLQKDSKDCMSCGHREPGGLQLFKNKWYCQICVHRTKVAESRLNGYEVEASKEAVMESLASPISYPTPTPTQAGYAPPSLPPNYPPKGRP